MRSSRVSIERPIVTAPEGVFDGAPADLHGFPSMRGRFGWAVAGFVLAIAATSGAASNSDIRDCRQDCQADLPGRDHRSVGVLELPQRRLRSQLLQSAERRGRRAGFLSLLPRRRLRRHRAEPTASLLPDLYQPVRQPEARGLRLESHLRENLPRAALLPPAGLQARASRTRCAPSAARSRAGPTSTTSGPRRQQLRQCKRACKTNPDAAVARVAPAGRDRDGGSAAVGRRAGGLQLPAAVHPHDRRQLLQPVPERLQGRPGRAQSLPAGLPQRAVRLPAQGLRVRRRESRGLLRRVLLAVLGRDRVQTTTWTPRSSARPRRPRPPPPRPAAPAPRG